MTGQNLLQFSPNLLVRRGLAACIVALLISVIVMLVLEVRNQLGMLDTSAAENVQWTLGQAETEIMAMELALLEARQAAPPEGDLDEIRLRFDIVYSRIDTLRRAQVLDELRTLEGVEERLGSATAFRDAWVPIIDGPDDALREELPRLLTEARQVRRDLRGLALEGIAFFARSGDDRRIEISRILTSIGMMTIALVGVLLILILAVLRLARQREREGEANRETRERIEAIISSSLDAVVVVDHDNRIIDWNGAAERVFGYSRSEAIGSDMPSMIVPLAFRDSHRASMKRYLDTHQGRILGRGIVQLEAMRKGGATFPVDLSLARAQSPRGEVFVAFIRDISDRARNEQALKRARDRAVAGEKQKAELLAVMSHEMRTPLNGILGTLGLFHEDQLDAENQRYLRIIRHSGELLLDHVNDVLDISRLDAGKMSLRKTRFDLVQLLEQIVESQGPHARARGNALLLAPPSPELHEVYSDPDRLRQILLNLVSNAIKFTSDGKIVIEADCAPDRSSVELRVTDTGVGITPENIDRIFDDFVTIDSTYGRHNHGTGLGLGISRRLATALGGELGAESEPGDGSVFWLHLPVAPPEENSGRAAPAPVVVEPESPDLPPLNVLLVEDNAINREVAREMLRRDGHTVTEAEDGEIGVSLASRAEFDVILMDISMPGMDGMTAARTIRRGRANARTPIIAATAHALPHEVQAFHAAGMTTVLTKPINAAALRRALADALTEETAGVPPPTAPTSDLVEPEHFAELCEDLAPQRLQEALRVFNQEFEDFLQSTSVTLAEAHPDLKAIATEAHRLAGSAGVFGALPLAAQLRDLETQARRGDAIVLKHKAEAVETLWTGTQAALDALVNPAG